MSVHALKQVEMFEGEARSAPPVHLDADFPAVRGYALDLPRGVLAALCRHCEACAPEEAVGVLLEHGDAWLHRPLPNGYNAQRVKEPDGWPKSNRTAFLISARDWMTVEDEANALGARIAVLYHSHVNAPAALSVDDLNRLRPGGMALVDGLVSLVVEVRNGRAVAATSVLL